MFLGNTILLAQDKPVVQVEVIDEDAQDAVNKSEIHGVMSVKMNPLLFFRGDIPLYIETTVTSQFAFEVGAGVTIEDYFNFQLYVSDEYSSTIKPELGFSGRVGVRYYAANYGYQPEGLYFGLDYRLQKYNSTLTQAGTVSLLNQNLSRLNSDVRLTMGYVNYWGDNFFIEPYAGFGIRSRTMDKATPNETANTVSVSSETDLFPILSLGAKIGIWF